MTDPASSVGACAYTGLSPKSLAFWCAAIIDSTSRRSAASSPHCAPTKAARSASSQASAAWKISVICLQRSGFIATHPFEAGVQPCARGPPFSFGGRHRNLQNLAGLCQRESAEEPQFCYLALARIKLSKLIERGMQVQHINIMRLTRGHDIHQ